MFLLLVKKKMKKMESGSIQLTYGFIHDKNPGGELHFDLHQDFKRSCYSKSNRMLPILKILR